MGARIVYAICYIESLWLGFFVRCFCRGHNLHLLVLAHKEFPFPPDPDCLFPKSSFLNRFQYVTRRAVISSSSSLLCGRRMCINWLCRLQVTQPDWRSVIITDSKLNLNMYENEQTEWSAVWYGERTHVRCGMFENKILRFYGHTERMGWHYMSTNSVRRTKTGNCVKANTTDNTMDRTDLWVLVRKASELINLLKPKTYITYHL